MALNLWLFGQIEKRNQDYTDRVVDSLEREVVGLETHRRAAGLYGRAFASAKVMGSKARSPEILDGMSRTLIKRGQWFGAIEDDPAPRLTPASGWTIQGGSDPRA